MILLRKTKEAAVTLLPLYVPMKVRQLFSRI